MKKKKEKEKKSVKRLKSDKLYLILALQMEAIKDNIEMNNNDPHKINP